MHLPCIPYFGHGNKNGGLRSTIVGGIALTIAIITSSTYVPLGKELSGAVTPLTLVLISEVFILFFTMMSFGIVSLGKEIADVRKKEVLPIVAFGLFGLISNILFFTGMQMTTAVNAELFTRSRVLFGVVLSALFFKETFNRLQISGCGVLLGGIALITFQGFTHAFELNAGDGIVILSVLSLSIGTICIKKSLHRIHPELILSCRAAMTIVAFFLFSQFTDHTIIHEIRDFPLELLWTLLAFGFFSRFLYVLSFYEAVERISVSKVYVISTLNIIGTILVAHYYLHEALAWYHLAGALLIIIGTIMMQLTHLHCKEKHRKCSWKIHYRHHL